MSETDIELPGVVEAPDTRREQAEGTTFVLTAAQSNTKLHEGFWNALQHYCADRKAELHVSRYMYNKNGLNQAGEKPDADSDGDTAVWFDPRIEPFVSDESLQLAPDLVWCGELNILPTRVNPISGFQHYTRMDSCIIPHAKMAMESVANMKNMPSKQVFTTGTVTQRNYIQKTAGQKAEFHHVFGALIVEVDHHGTWWVRQLNASSDGSFYDLNKKYTPNGVSKKKHRVQAITHGDIHGYKMDMDVIDAVFGKHGILDVLKPREQFFHDLIDFMPRNHHNIKDHLFLHQMHAKGCTSVESEFDVVASFITGMGYRKWCNSFVVVSNHDQAINTWLRNTDAIKDPPNVEFWLKMNLYSIQNKSAHPFREALTTAIRKITRDKRAMPRILLEDDSYRILDEIEAALHGHLGTNGSRGSPRNLRGGGKVNSAHTHSPGIFEGVYTAGVYGLMDMGYNNGMSSWAHAFTLTYPNAKRAICTIKDGRAWR